MAPCIAGRSGAKVLCANFIANPVLLHTGSTLRHVCCAQMFYLQIFARIAIVSSTQRVSTDAGGNTSMSV